MVCANRLLWIRPVSRLDGLSMCVWPWRLSYANCSTPLNFSRHLFATPPSLNKGFDLMNRSGIWDNFCKCHRRKELLAERGRGIFVVDIGFHSMISSCREKPVLQGHGVVFTVAQTDWGVLVAHLYQKFQTCRAFLALPSGCSCPRVPSLHPH